VYCFRKTDCEAVAKVLQTNGISAEAYHSGISDANRKKTQDSWNSGQTQVVCATTSFGMGINKPDVRFVFHHYVPRSISALYQQAGRAGRDGKSSIHVMYFSNGDTKKLMYKTTKKDKVKLAQLKQVKTYCSLFRGVCRRKFLLGILYDNDISNNNKVNINNITCNTSCCDNFVLPKQKLKLKTKKKRKVSEFFNLSSNVSSLKQQQKNKKLKTEYNGHTSNKQMTMDKQLFQANIAQMFMFSQNK
jgi:superfamily II DNA helicase RecQ